MPKHTMPPSRRRRVLVAALSALVAVGAVATVAVVPTSAQSDGTTRHVGVCRTDDAGYCWERHGLGIVPVNLAVRPRPRGNHETYTLAVVPDSLTASRFRLRAVGLDGTPQAHSVVRFVYWLASQLPTTTTTTTSPTTTTTTSPTTTTSTSATPSPTPTTTATTTTAARAPAPTGTAGPVCGTAALDGGPATPPSGAVTVPAGDNSGVDFRRANTVYWFAPGVHTLGSDAYAQIIPGDGATFVGAPSAILDGRNVNRYAFTQHATGVTIRYLEIRNFQPPIQEGVVNHDGGDGWLMAHLYIHDVNGSAIMFGSHNTLRHSCLTRNGQYGWNSIGGSGDIVMRDNEISYNNTGDWESQLPGCGCSGGGKFWDAHTVRVLNNWVHDNHGTGIWADQNNYDFLIAGNLIEDNETHAIEYETSYNAVIRDNVLRRNSWKIGREFAARGDTFPIGTIYLSEAGYDPRLPAPEGATAFVIKNNTLENNWGGIAGWENADRFCNSPANTSTGYCTIKSHAAGTATWYDTSDCTQPRIAAEPMYSDCRWQTKNLDIHHNTFRVDTSQVDGGCAPRYCATMSLFSNYGTVPDWSPYKGRRIQESITFRQGNRWHDNSYTGAWRWVAYEPGRYLTLSQWQASPYHQDAGSS